MSGLKTSPSALAAPAGAPDLLEFAPVREWLAGYTNCDRARGLALALLPARDLAEVRRRLRELAEAKRLVELRGAWAAPPADDPRPWLEAARRGQRLEGGVLAKVALLLEAVERAARYWAEAAGEAPTAAAAAAWLRPARTLREALQRAVDAAGEVQDAASPELARLRGRWRLARERIRERLERMVAKGTEGDAGGEGSFVTQRDGRYVVSLRADRFDRSRGVVHDVSRSGAVVFVEPFAVLPLNNELRELAAAESEEIARVLEGLSREVEAHADDLDAGSAALAELDVLWARVRLSQAIGGTTPEVADGAAARFDLRRARHPLLWRQAGGEADGRRAGEAIVPFDLVLTSPQRVLLVSGPNMGGKTVLLKAVGLAVAMAHAGLDICAAEGSRLPFVARLFVDIGDAQSLEDHLSTFAGRLLRMDAMARGGGPEALCLLDEVGAGTDPEEGAALARALLERLAGLGAWTVATTHLGSLKGLAGERPEVVNASMEIDGERLAPLFRLRVGVPGGSYGLATARRLGLEPSVLERAERAVPDEARAVERLLAELGDALARAEEERAALEATHAELSERLARATEREGAAEAQRRESEKRRLTELGVLEAQARALLREVRREAQKAAAERDAGALRALATQVRALEKAGDAWREAAAVEDAGPGLAEVAVGMEVRHVGLDVVGRVVEGPDAQGNVVLARGTWRITCRVADLRGPARDGPAAQPPSRPARAAGARPEAAGAGPEVDVRGLAADEAVVELDRALDRAVLAGLSELRVIHGVGRGVLRDAVVRHLTGHPQVAGQRLGGVGEGGRGVTVAQLA